MGGRSLFALVENFEYMVPGYYSIIQLDPECLPDYTRILKLDEIETVRFSLPLDPLALGHLCRYWLFSPLEGSSQDLYMVPNWKFTEGEIGKPLSGYKFSFSDGSFLPISLPEYYRNFAFVASLKGKIYLFSHDSSTGWHPKRTTDFKRYDPVEDLWEPLQPFRYKVVQHRYIPATAVWDDAILLFGGGSAGIWAYDVNRNKWYPVNLENPVNLQTPRCKDIVKGIVPGGAVVVRSFIYALTNRSIVVLSIKKELINNDFVFTCCLLSDNELRFLSENNEGLVTNRSRHLVYLGEDEFCVVQSCDLFPSDHRHIQVTCIKFKSYKSLVFIRNYRVKFRPCWSVGGTDEFNVRFCFSLPKGAATTLEKGKNFFLDLFPKEEQVQEEQLREPHEQGNKSAVGSSSLGKSKLKNHGKGFRFKTTCARHNGGWGFYQPCRPKGKKRPNKVADLELQVSGLVNHLKKEKELLKNDLTKMKERLTFLEEALMKGPPAFLEEEALQKEMEAERAMAKI